MPKKRLIDATDLVRRVLEERDQIRTEVVHRYSFGVPTPDQSGQAMRGGIRKALRCIETSPTVDAVEVVRCRDCKHWIVDYYWNSDPDQVRACRYAGWICGANGYCLYGERKMDAEVQENA